MTEEITKEHQEMLKRHEEYEKKAEKAKVTYKTGITGEYEPFRELVCPVMTNVAHSVRDIYCRGPLCGHWSRRLNMCGTATMGEMAWTHLEYHKDYQATIEMYRKEEKEKEKEGEEKERNQVIVDSLQKALHNLKFTDPSIEELETAKRMINNAITKIPLLKLEPKEKEEEKLSPDIERQEEYFKNFNTYHFNFSVEIPDTLSEEEQKYISENLLGNLNGHLFDKGFHLPSIRVKNEWYKKEK